MVFISQDEEKSKTIVMQNLGLGKQDALWSMWKYPESLKPMRNCWDWKEGAHNAWEEPTV